MSRIVRTMLLLIWIVTHSLMYLSNCTRYAHAADSNGNLFRVQRWIEQHRDRVEIDIAIIYVGVFAVSPKHLLCPGLTLGYCQVDRLAIFYVFVKLPCSWTYLELICKCLRRHGLDHRRQFCTANHHVSTVAWQRRPFRLTNAYIGCSLKRCSINYPPFALLKISTE